MSKLGFKVSNLLNYFNQNDLYTVINYLGLAKKLKFITTVI